MRAEREMDDTRDCVLAGEAAIRALRACKAAMSEAQSIARVMEEERLSLGVGAMRMDGMPRACGRAASLQERLLLRMEEIERTHLAAIEAYARAVQRAEDILSAMKDAKLRAFCRIRYVEGLSVQQTALTMGLSRRTAERMEARAKAGGMGAAEHPGGCRKAK